MGMVLVILSVSDHLYHYSPSLGFTNERSHPVLTEPHDHVVSSSSSPLPPTHIIPPIYKPTPSASVNQIVDNFPLAASAQSSTELPSIPSWNAPPTPHVKETTPLFIGFMGNWRLLQQVVVSYITSGWPADDIYIVENMGVMDSNALGLLSLQNAFFLNHTRLEILGVNTLVTPTLLTFAQVSRLSFLPPSSVAGGSNDPY